MTMTMFLTWRQHDANVLS